MTGLELDHTVIRDETGRHESPANNERPAATARAASVARVLNLEVNGETQTVAVGPYESLNMVLRERLNLTGTKRGCDTGGCGTCTVLVDGQAVYSCMYPSLRAEGKAVRTVEGLVPRWQAPPHATDPGRRRWRAVRLLHAGCVDGVHWRSIGRTRTLTLASIAEELAGNLCRCTGYVKLIEGLASARETMKEIYRD